MSANSCTTRRNLGTTPIRWLGLYDCRAIGYVHFRHNNRVKASQLSDLATGYAGKLTCKLGRKGGGSRQVKAADFSIGPSKVGLAIGPNLPKRARNKHSWGL